MKTHVKFPSIEQFRHTVKQVRDRSNYHQIATPTLKFHGTVKLHGSNAAVVCKLSTGEIWSQSRTAVITPLNDNAGFAKFVESHKQSFVNLFEIAKVVDTTLLSPNTHIAIYGEWCGQGIQKGVAISEVSKRFVIFAVRVINKFETVDEETDEQDKSSYWFNPAKLISLYNTAGPEALSKENIFCIENYATWNVEIDFTNPELIQNSLQELTLKVEDECPVGKAFGVEGIGEGIVWSCWDPTVPFKVSDLTFKVKGPKHSDSKVKTLASVDVEKVNSVNAFVESTVSEHRLEKMVDLIKQAGLSVEPKNMGAFLKLVGSDIEKEETDVLEASGLTWKDVSNAVNRNAREWFLEQYNSGKIE